MEILGIGPLEVLFILLIAFIVLGPGDMAKTGRTVGRFLRQVVTSQWWSGFRAASKEIRQLPITLMREASVEETTHSLNELGKIKDDLPIDSSTTNPADFSSWTRPTHKLGDQRNDERFSG